VSATAPDAYRVDGPQPALRDPRRVLNLALVLARTDWKVRFFGSALGYVWSLLRPLLLFAILYVVFSEIVGLGDHLVANPQQLL
jgi:ABC-2 type transport system permease protein